MPADFGHYTDDAAYVVTRAATPRPWLNYLWNRCTCATVSQVGQGETIVEEDGRRQVLHRGRMVHLVDVDTGTTWNANGLPVAEAGDRFRCTHGFGTTAIETERHGIATRWEIVVPREEAGELWAVTVTNRSRDHRQLRIVPAVDSPVGGWFAAATHGWYDDDLRAVCVEDVIRTGSHHAHEADGSRERAFLTIDGEPSGFDARRSAFVGPYGSFVSPAALAGGGCTGGENEFERSVLALEMTVLLDPGASKALHALVGTWRERDDIRRLRARFFATGAIGAERAAVEAGHRRHHDVVGITTPDPDLDRFVNTWLPHQLRLNATWARVYFYGFRDLCQDAANLAAIDPAQAAAVLREVLRRQYSSGYAPRAWLGDELVEQDYADSPVWLAPAVLALVRQTGEAAFLDEQVPFTDGEEDTVYQHVRRSLDHLWGRRGARGLSLMRRGDWNDVMNGVGREGRGESVWLSQALHRALLDGVALAGLKGRAKDAVDWRERAAELAAAIEAQAWDGTCYRRAFTDDGKPVGGVDTPEGVFLNPQAWAALSGAAADDRARGALRAVDERLETAEGFVTVEHPFAGGFRPEIGFVSAIRPGANVNGGIYLHANAFKLIADCRLGRRSAAWRTLTKILPFGPARYRATGEPFVVPNCYYGPRAGYRAGRSGSGWLTGTAGWLLTAIVEHVFGIRAGVDGLRVDPCLPAHWTECRLRRRYRGADYDFEFRQEPRTTGPEVTVSVDGGPWTGDVLPCAAGKRYRVAVHLA